ncbi:hypothetical protein EYF80_053404 [Liparis tanakae]|uniref:Uncharacterized protein n=1 Tax=Liparis tanakae TaxID=230148 RepID=A0A4Z2F5T7_9TELE|nr:hypothetical protein EYF80_053404 [Liparis tanakae]
MSFKSATLVAGRIRRAGLVFDACDVERRQQPEDAPFERFHGVTSSPLEEVGQSRRACSREEGLDEGMRG